MPTLNTSSRWARAHLNAGLRYCAAYRQYPDGAICITWQIGSTP